MMKRLGKILAALIILAAILVAFYFISSYITFTTGYAIKSYDSSIVGECMANRKVVFYTEIGCPLCEKQLKELSEAKQIVEVVDCFQEQQRCSVLSEMPAFEYDKGLYYGLKELDEIRLIVGC